MIVTRKKATTDSSETITSLRLFCLALLPTTIWSWTSSPVNPQFSSPLVRGTIISTPGSLILDDNYRYKTRKSRNTALYDSPVTKERSTFEEKAIASSSTGTTANNTPTPEGLPWWWDMVWKLDIMKLGKEGEDIIFGDSANVLRTNIEQIYGGFPSRDGCPLADGDISDIADGTMFIGLQRYFQNYGSPYKLCFGPKSFLVISDPMQARHILRDANVQYDKVRIQTHI
jgi:hypothetical protein